jgi:hypothetical protein
LGDFLSTLSTELVQGLTEITSGLSTPPLIKESGGAEIIVFFSAWVSFNGTGTVAIADSFNVSSITDNGVGDYDLNFTRAMVNNTYAITGNAQDAATNAAIIVLQQQPAATSQKTASACPIHVARAHATLNRTLTDVEYVEAFVVGGLV